jgi:hypothetical protein
MSQEEQIILICATPRSGSTTLQRIFHESLTDAHFCGENGGAVNALLECYRQIKRTTAHSMNSLSYSEIIKQGIKPSWYNVYNLDQVVEHIRQLIRSLFAHARIWGFKEIRYENGQLAYLEEFRELFPQLKCVLLIRENLGAQSKSGWLAQRPNAMHDLQILNRSFTQFHQQHNDYTYFMTFERMFQSQEVKKMFQFVLPYENPDFDRIQYILTNNLKD